VSAVTQTTQSIIVSVQTTPIQEECRPEEARFAFSYTIRIENCSEHTVQLLERHWIIESADRKTGEVVGSGVVGLQPVLEPGQHFEYTSNTLIEEPIGAMHGSYIFGRKGGGFFTVRIPRFSLVYSQLCN
jgi:ApaG protein